MLTGFEQRLRGAARLKPAALPDLDRLNRLAQIVLHAEAALALAAAVRGDLDTLAPSTRAIALPGWAMPAVWYRHALAQAAPLRAAFLAGSLGDADLLLAPCFPQACRTATRSRPPAPPSTRARWPRCIAITPTSISWACRRWCCRWAWTAAVAPSARS